MKKHYVLAIILAASMRLQAQDISESSFGPRQVIAQQPGIAYAADLDGDGDQDVVSFLSDSSSRYPRGGDIYWYENQGQGNFGEQQLISSVSASFDLQLTDLDDDGDLDVLARTSDDASDKYWYENDGQGNFTEQLIATSVPTNGFDLIDLDNDGDQDLLSFVLGGSSYWYENDGQGNFTEQQISSQGGRLNIVDIDGDGDQDIVDKIYSAYNVFLYWRENDGEGNFKERQLLAEVRGEVLIPFFNRLDQVFFTDLDGDGDQDLLASLDQAAARDTRKSSSLSWYQNNGQGNFGEEQVIDSFSGEGSIRLAYITDLDGDGDQDILTSSYTEDTFTYDYTEESKVSWYPNEGQGSFGDEQVIIRSTTNRIGFVSTADLDGDSDQDVLAAEVPFSGSADEPGVVAWYENQLSEQLANEPSITALSLFNARTDTEVQPLTDGLVLDLLSPEPNLYDYNVAAEVEARGQTITRVTFELDAPDAANQDTIRTEQKAPYVLFGHLGQDFREVQAYAGDYTLTATPYYQDSTGAEVAGQSQTVNFTFVTPNMDIREPRLVDARSGEEIESLEAGDMISLAPDQPVGVQVDTRFPEFNSVEFFLDGPSPDGQTDVQQLENFLPYSLFGDGGAGTVPDGQPLAEGEYELRIIAYLGKNRDGYAGPERVIPFSVVHEASEGESLAYPVPFADELNLQVGQVDLSQTRIQLVHSYGQVYEVSSSQLQVTEEGLRINVVHLPTGPYTIHVQQADGVQTFRASKQ